MHIPKWFWVWLYLELSFDTGDRSDISLSVCEFSEWMAFILCMCNDEEKDLTQRKYTGEMFSYQYTLLKLTCLSCNDENV